MTAKQPARQCFLLVAEALFSIFKNEWGFFLSLKKQRRGGKRGEPCLATVRLVFAKPILESSLAD